MTQSPSSLRTIFVAGLLCLGACSRESSTKTGPDALRRPSVNLSGYKDLTWGQIRPEVESVWPLKPVDADPLAGDRLMRWGHPAGGKAACQLVCGTSFQDAMWIWYGVPYESLGEGKDRTVRPDRNAVPEAKWEVYRVDRYDEYVTFSGGELVAYWFPLSMKDWQKARDLLQQKYGSPWGELTPHRIKSKTPDFEEEIVFEYRGSAWFGPLTNIYALTERYKKEDTAFTLGYVLYLDGSFDLRTQIAVRERLREIENAKKAMSKDEEFVKSVIE